MAHPSFSPVYPWIILFFLCWITFGSYWVFDTPGSIQSYLTKWFDGPHYDLCRNVTNSTSPDYSPKKIKELGCYTKLSNDNLYSVYSYPNFVLAIFGGYIMDRFFGLRMGTLLFCGLVFAGQVTFALGVQFRYYWVAIAGRFIFGLGGESLTVGQNAYTARWFDGKRLSLALGLVVAFSRIGSSINFAVTPIFAEDGVPFSVWFGTATCLVSLVACIAAGLLDWYGQPRLDSKKSEEGDRPPETVSLLDIRHFPVASWVIFLICVLFYISVLTFYTAAADIMENSDRGYSATVSSQFLVFPNFVAIFAAPLFGFLIDRFGRSLYVLALASVMMIVAHICFLAMFLDWFFIHPIAIMIWIGFGYSLFAASIWPLLPFVIRESQLATAYGVMTAIQNLGLGLGPTIIGSIQGANGISGTKKEYIIPLFIFMCCAAGALLLTFLLMFVDKRFHSGALNGNGEAKLLAKTRLNSEPLVDERSPLINPST